MRWICALAVLALVALAAFRPDDARAEGSQAAACTPPSAREPITGSTPEFYRRALAEDLARTNALNEASRICGKRPVPEACSNAWMHAAIDYGEMDCQKARESDNYKCVVKAEFHCICTMCKKPPAPPPPSSSPGPAAPPEPPSAAPATIPPKPRDPPPPASLARDGRADKPSPGAASRSRPSDAPAGVGSFDSRPSPTPPPPVSSPWNKSPALAAAEANMNASIASMATGSSGGGGPPDRSGHAAVGIVAAMSNTHVDALARFEFMGKYLGFGFGTGVHESFQSVSQRYSNGLRRETSIGAGVEVQMSFFLNLFNPHEWTRGEAKRHRVSIGGDMGVIYEPKVKAGNVYAGPVLEVAFELPAEVGIVLRGGYHFALIAGEDAVNERSVWRHWFVGLGPAYFTHRNTERDP